MAKTILFPHAWRIPGIFMFVVGLGLGVFTLFSGFEFSWLAVDIPWVKEGGFLSSSKNNLTDEVMALLIIVGGLLTAFSREKVEDEFIREVRLQSLLWATYANYGLLILALIFFYNDDFFLVMVFNMFTLLIIFIIRYYGVLWINQSKLTDEK
jgi:hypothetical protein